MSFPTVPINTIVSGYKEAFDWLHQATSRNITVHVEPLSSGCPNHAGYDHIQKRAFNIYKASNPFPTGTITVIPSLNISGILNQSFTSGTLCPVCGGNGNLYSPASGTVSARIQWRTAENETATRGVKASFPDEANVRLKVTGAVSTELLDRAMAVDIDGFMCKVVKGHMPVGLRDVHTWEYFLKRNS